MEDDDSSGSEFVGQEEAVDELEFIDPRKRKVQVEDKGLNEDELDDIMRELDGGAEVKKKKAKTVRAPAFAEAAQIDVKALLAGISGKTDAKEAVQPKKKPKDKLKSALADLRGRGKKVSTLDKSQTDWAQFKTESGTQDELSKHMKGKTYLEKQAFLKRTELREYEKERMLKK